MKNRTAYLAIVSGALSGALYFTAAAPSFAQDALSSCNAATGLTPSGQQCVTLTRVDPTRYQTQVGGEGAANYSAVNVGELAETYQCDPSGGGSGSGIGGSILIEDCGQPLNLDPSTFQEFVGYSGGAPAPVPTPAPAPVPYVAPIAPPSPPVVLATPTPPVYAPVPGLGAAGLSGAGLIAAGVGVAAVAGIAALAFGDDDNDSATSTTQ